MCLTLLSAVARIQKPVYSTLFFFYLQLFDTCTELSIESTGWGAIMLQSMDELRETQLLCDISVVVTDGSVLMAHGVVLSAGSTFFKDILQKAKSSGTSIIVKCNFSRKAMEFVFDFLYRGKISPTLGDVVEILKAAETFGIQSLVTLCQVFNNQEDEVNVISATDPESGNVTQYVVQQTGEDTYTEEDGVEGETTATAFVDQNTAQLLLPEGALEATEFEGTEQLGVYNECITTEIFDENTASFRKVYRYPCDQCHRQFTSRGRLMGHKATHKGEKGFKCDVCGETFIQMEYLREHASIHTKEKPFKCTVCNLAFRIKRHLKKHVTIHTGRRPFVCEYCKATFRRSDAYKNHLRIHTGERPFTCKICGKKFRLMETLRRHAYIHTGKRPYKCPECPMTYRQRGGLINHQLIHSGKKPFVCETPGCKAEFRLKKQLQRHMVAIHSEGRDAEGGLEEEVIIIREVESSVNLEKDVTETEAEAEPSTNENQDYNVMVILPGSP